MESCHCTWHKSCTEFKVLVAACMNTVLTSAICPQQSFTKIKFPKVEGKILTNNKKKPIKRYIFTYIESIFVFGENKLYMAIIMIKRVKEYQRKLGCV